jgi:hypothetical protein
MVDAGCSKQSREDEPSVERSGLNVEWGQQQAAYESTFEIRSYEGKKLPQCEDAVRFDVICSCFADALSGTNSQFMRELFLDACKGKR